MTLVISNSKNKLLKEDSNSPSLLQVRDGQGVDKRVTIRCRQITATDLETVTNLLSEGFPRRHRRYWVRALQLLSRRECPSGFPRYGYMIENGSVAVGVLLLIFAQMPGNDGVRCNHSSWYVAPEFRSYAPLLLRKTLVYPVTHTNVWPSLHTLPTIEALGFNQFCDGVFAAITPLSSRTGIAKVRRIQASADLGKSVSDPDRQLLRDHEGFGCISLWCETQDGGYSFIFRRRFVKALPMVPAAQLIYCPSTEDFVRFAGPLGRYLALHGMPFMLVPANCPIPGLSGKYVGEKRMYYIGSGRPRLGDLAYTEVAMFGI